MKSGKTKQLIAFLLSAFFVLSLLVPAMPAKASPALQGPMASMDKELREKLLAGGPQDVLLALREQPNVEGAIQTLSSALGRELSPLEQRKAVIGELQSTAHAAQFSLMQQLRSEQKAGRLSLVQPFYIVNAIHVQGEASAILALAKHKDVAAVYPNTIRPLVEPTQPSKEEKEPVHPDTIGWNIKKIYADRVWNEFKIDGSGVLVGVIDSGVNAAHPALRKKFKAYDPTTDQFDPKKFPESFKDFNNNKTEPYDDDKVPHGSHVSGTILGGEDNGTNNIGVAPGAKFIVAKALTAMGGSDAALLGAAEWMLAPGGKAENAPRIINNSWGGGDDVNPWFVDVITRWRKAGILPVFAAGNQRPGQASPWPGSISNPANVLGSFAVAATDINNRRGSFSFLGPSKFDKTGKIIKPDVSAPGVGVRSSVLGTDYVSMNGTSMAAPHVAGLAALLLQANPNLKVEELEEIMIRTAMPLKDQQFPETPNMGYGHGNINAYDAVSEALGVGTGVVSGKLLEAQKDTVAPEMKISFPETLYADQDIPVSISLKDNVGITSAALKYKKVGDTDWIFLPLKRTSGTVKDGIYEATIPAKDAKYPAVDLLVDIEDFGNHKDSQMIRLDLKLGITPGEYFNDFEANTLGWKFERTFGTGEPKGSLEPSAFSGKKVLGTHVGENSAEPHPGRTPVPDPIPQPIDDGGVADPGVSHPKGDFIAVAPPMDLRAANAENAVISLHYVFKNNPKTAKAVVEASTDQKTWTVLKELDRTTLGWNEAKVSLGKFVPSKAQVFVRLRFTTDGSGMAMGLYVEDFRLGGTGKAATAAASSVQAITDGAHPILLQFPDQTTPISGTIRILETDRITDSDVLGTYTMRHAVDQQGAPYTLEASAYGYHSERRVIDIKKHKTTEEYFVLSPLAKANVVIQVKDRQTGKVLPNATVQILDDSNYGVRSTDDQGLVTFENVFEGPHVIRAVVPGHDSITKTFRVFAKDNEILNLELNPFVGQESIIQYGQEFSPGFSGLAFVDPGAGIAMRFTAQKTGKVMGTRMGFTDRRNDARGREIGVLILRAGADGEIKPVARPKIVQIVPGELATISLEEYDVVVKEGEEFYISTFQVHKRFESPAISTAYMGNAQDQEAYSRAFAWAGVLIPFSDEAVGIKDQYPIIHAVMSDGERQPAPIATPQLKNHSYLTYTKDQKVTLEGTAPAGSTVRILEGGKEIAKAQASDGSFSTQLNLSKEETRITLQAQKGQDVSDVSSAYSFVLDQQAPMIALTAPKDQEKVTKRELVVRGTVTEANLQELTLNGATIAALAGRFEQRVVLIEGKNVITLSAKDRAGNEVKKTLEVHYEREPGEDPVLSLSEMTPEKNHPVKAGDRVTFSFVGTPKMNAFYALEAPLALSGVEPTWTAMQEVAPGHYKAEWIVPENLHGSFAVKYQLQKDEFKAFGEAKGKIVAEGPVAAKVRRIFGLDRFTTAVELSKEGFPKANTVVLAQSSTMADAVLAGPLAQALKAPILLTEKTALPEATKQELQRLSAKNIILVGGEGTIDSSLEKTLKKSFNVERLGGKSRIETSLAVARKIQLLTKNNSFFLVNGNATADALSVGAISGRAGEGTTPILFAQQSNIPTQVQRYLSDAAYQKAFVIGGTLSLDAKVFGQLKAYQPERIFGATRAHTSLAIADRFMPQSTRFALTGGERGIDALAAAPLLAQKGMPILLIQRDRLPKELRARITPDLFEVLILGGNGVVSEQVEQEVRSLLN
ncbi:N-acetylmuramoyl-L-alanine amidase [Clostridiaceae bacterium JG1575]|nr:N-acetylmuramoyl-L-alanine amidase [Clostridiaceae bacterium JG1575]